MKYQSVLEEEYKKAGKKVVWCILGKNKIIVPLSYKGEVNRFIDDIFSYEKEADKYNEFNRKCTLEEDKIDTEMLSVGEIKFLPPLDLVQFDYSNEKIIKKSILRAILKYRSSVKKTVKVQKEYPNQALLCSMDDSYLKDLDKKHRLYCVKSILSRLGKTIKFSVEQAAQMASGATGITPVLLYRLLDKKIRFSDTKAKRIIDKKVVPYICKGALKDMIALSLIGGAKITFQESEYGKKLKSNIEMHSAKIKNNFNQPQTLNISNQSISDVSDTSIEISETKTDFNKKYKISNDSDFEALYNDAVNFLAVSMFPTEILVDKCYSDAGTTKNTIGLGSYWYPANDNPESSKWIKTSQYIKNNKQLNISGQKAIDLMNGWFRYRENGRIYKDMCRRLNGCSLTVNEFAAIATVMYNSEESGRVLCDFVKKHYKDEKKCALKIMQLKPGNSKFSDGIKKRHAHEALIYLNVNDYAQKIPYLVIKKGINSKGAEYYVSSVTQLRVSDCDMMEQGLKRRNLDGAEQLVEKICNYRCKNGEPVYAIAERNGVGYLCDINSEAYARSKISEDLYKIAINHYKNKDYEKALSGFNNLIAKGFDGADIHNDIAITYFNMGKYEQCIDECQKVLDTGEIQMHPAANYNAGKAYEKLGDIQRAAKNYKRAAKLAPDNKVYKNAVNNITKKDCIIAQNRAR